MKWKRRVRPVGRQGVGGGAKEGPQWRVGLQKGVMLRLTKVSLHDGVVGGLGHEL